MYIYLPIAEVPINSIVIIFMGVVAGIFSGVFGIGGGFFMTPILIFMGVPPAVAVSSSANQIIGSSFSGFISNLKHKNVDFKMGIYLLIGSLFGSIIGIYLFSYWSSIGQIDFYISIFYVVFLGSISVFMLYEGYKTLKHINGVNRFNHKFINEWLLTIKMPFITYFPHSNIKISLILPLLVGWLVGILVSLMGIGGGFISIPAMIYILGMTTTSAVATSLFQIIFTTMFVTMLHAMTTNTIDIILVLIMLIGAVIGAQLGTKISRIIDPVKLRLLLALIVFLMVVKLALGLFMMPENIYQVVIEK